MSIRVTIVPVPDSAWLSAELRIDNRGGGGYISIGLRVLSRLSGIYTGWYVKWFRGIKVRRYLVLPRFAVCTVYLGVANCIYRDESAIMPVLVNTYHMCVGPSDPRLNDAMAGAARWIAENMGVDRIAEYEGMNILRTVAQPVEEGEAVFPRGMRVAIYRVDDLPKIEVDTMDYETFVQRAKFMSRRRAGKRGSAQHGRGGEAESVREAR